MRAGGRPRRPLGHPAVPPRGLTLVPGGSAARIPAAGPRQRQAAFPRGLRRDGHQAQADEPGARHPPGPRSSRPSRTPRSRGLPRAAEGIRQRLPGRAGLADLPRVLAHGERRGQACGLRGAEGPTSTPVTARARGDSALPQRSHPDNPQQRNDAEAGTPTLAPASPM